MGPSPGVTRAANVFPYRYAHDTGGHDEWRNEVLRGASVSDLLEWSEPRPHPDPTARTRGARQRHRPELLAIRQTSARTTAVPPGHPRLGTDPGRTHGLTAQPAAPAPPTRRGVPPPPLVTPFRRSCPQPT